MYNGKINVHINVHTEERWLSCQCPMATISPSPAFSLNRAQLLWPSRYFINVCGMNGQSVLTCSICTYVNNVIPEYGKERYISSCNKRVFNISSYWRKTEERYLREKQRRKRGQQWLAPTPTGWPLAPVTSHYFFQNLFCLLLTHAIHYSLKKLTRTFV